MFNAYDYAQRDCFQYEKTQNDPAWHDALLALGSSSSLIDYGGRILFFAGPKVPFFYNLILLKKKKNVFAQC